MAAREHKVSRRVLLGAVCAAPFVPPVLSLSKGHAELDSASTFLPAPQPARWIPARVRNDESPESAERQNEQSFAVTKCDRAPSPPAHPEPSRRTPSWDSALAAFRRAERVVNAAAGEPDEDRYDRLLGRFNDAMRRLLRTPAPHLPALAAKLRIAAHHTAWELTGAETCIAALVRDAARLASLSSRSS